MKKAYPQNYNEMCNLLGKTIFLKGIKDVTIRNKLLKVIENNSLNEIIQLAVKLELFHEQANLLTNNFNQINLNFPEINAFTASSDNVADTTSFHNKPSNNESYFNNPNNKPDWNNNHQECDCCKHNHWRSNDFFRAKTGNVRSGDIKYENREPTYNSNYNQQYQQQDRNSQN